MRSTSILNCEAGALFSSDVFDDVLAYTSNAAVNVAVVVTSRAVAGVAAPENGPKREERGGIRDVMVEEFDEDIRIEDDVRCDEVSIPVG